VQECHPKCVNALFIEARAVLDPGDLGVPFFRRLLKTEAVSLRPAPFASEGPLIALNHRNRRQRSRLATRTGSFLQEESACNVGLDEGHARIACQRQ
jgi:hypothetical protein